MMNISQDFCAEKYDAKGLSGASGLLTTAGRTGGVLVFYTF